jgi:hypothetical protein
MLVLALGVEGASLSSLYVAHLTAKKGPQGGLSFSGAHGPRGHDFGTLRVTARYKGLSKQAGDAERPNGRSHAARGNQEFSNAQSGPEYLPDWGPRTRSSTTRAMPI